MGLQFDYTGDNDVVQVPSTEESSTPRSLTVSSHIHKLLESLLKISVSHPPDTMVLILTPTLAVVESLFQFLQPQPDRDVPTREEFKIFAQQISMFSIARWYSTAFYCWTVPDGLCFYRAFMQGAYRSRHWERKGQFPPHREKEFQDADPDLRQEVHCKKFLSFLQESKFGWEGYYGQYTTEKSKTKNAHTTDLGRSIDRVTIAFAEYAATDTVIPISFLHAHQSFWGNIRFTEQMARAHPKLKLNFFDDIKTAVHNPTFGTIDMIFPSAIWEALAVKHLGVGSERGLAILKYTTARPGNWMLDNQTIFTSAAVREILVETYQDFTLQANHCYPLPSQDRRKLLEDAQKAEASILDMYYDEISESMADDNDTPVTTQPPDTRDNEIIRLRSGELDLKKQIASLCKQIENLKEGKTSTLTV
jgi:hypothetical protein